MENEKGQVLLKRGRELFKCTERTNVESLWAELSEFILNNQSGIFNGQDTPGGKKNRKVFDSTGPQSNRDLASAINSTVTNPSVKWAKWRFSDERLNEDEESNQWLEQANDLFHNVMNLSNFITEAGRAYKMFTALGSMALMQEQADLSETGEFTGFKFKAIHLSEIAWSENAFGSVDVAYIKMKMTLRQMAERFGIKNLPDKIKDSLTTKPEDTETVWHCIYPREAEYIKLNERGKGVGKNRPFASVYIHDNTAHILEEDGYYEFPIHVVRWDTLPGEVYGRGPGHDALPDVRTINRSIELFLSSLAKAIDPPILTESRNFLSSPDLRPARMSVVRDITKVKPWDLNLRLDITQLGLQGLQQSIKNNFFLDKLMLPPREEVGEMTAFEISQRLEQMQRVLGPTLGRLNAEFLDPLVTRSFNMMLRGNAFGELPPALAELGASIKVEYFNEMSRAQKLQDISNLQQWMQEVGGVAQMNPEVLDIVDFDAIISHSAKVRGIPALATRDPKVVKQIREQRAQQQQMQQQAMMMKEMAGAAADAGKAADSEGLQEMLGG